MVVAPDALIRYKAGKIWIHTGSTPAHAVFDKPAVLLLLSAFATPQTIEEAAGLCVLSVVETEQAIDSLKRIGALIPAPSNESLTLTNPSTERAASLAATHVRSLANATHHIAGDLMAFGPAIHDQMMAETGVSILARLEALLAGADALKSELAQRRDEFLAKQVQQLAPRNTAKPMKLHIGSGQHRLDSWINIDAHPAEFTMDVKWGFPFPDGSVEYAFLSHTLEHLYYPGEALGVMREIRRLLAPSGRVRIIVPDIEKCIQAYVQKDDEFYASRAKTWTWWTKTETRLEGFLTYAGAGPRPGSFFESHKFGYDFETIASLLRKAGFSQVERSEYMASHDPVLRVDSASLVAGAMYRDQYYSLFVEATP